MSHAIKNLVIHHSASAWADVAEITKWHLERGWRTIGYNMAILNGHRKYQSAYDKNEDGLFEMGRGLNFDSAIDSNEHGAHTLGYNHNSIGICFIGNGEPTAAQYESLYLFCAMWKRIVPGINVIGHGEVNDTSCPGFDVQKWLKEMGLK